MIAFRSEFTSTRALRRGVARGALVTGLLAGAALIGLGSPALAQGQPAFSWGLQGVKVQVQPGAPLSLHNPAGPNDEALETRVSGVVRSGMRRATNGVFVGRRATNIMATVRRFEGLSTGETLLGGGRMEGEIDLEIRDAVTGEVLARQTGLGFSRGTTSGLLGIGRGSAQTRYADTVARVVREWISGLSCADATCTVATTIDRSAQTALAAAPEPAAPEPAAPEPAAPEPAAPEPEPVQAETEEEGGGFFSGIADALTGDEVAEEAETEVAALEPDPAPVPAVETPATPVPTARPVEPEVDAEPEAVPVGDEEEEEGGFFSSIASVFSEDEEEDTTPEPEVEIAAVNPEPQPEPATEQEPEAVEPELEEPEVATLALAQPAAPLPDADRSARIAQPETPDPAVIAPAAQPQAGDLPPLPATAPRVAEPEPEPEVDLAEVTPAPAPSAPEAAEPDQGAIAPAPADSPAVIQPEIDEPVLALADPGQPVPRPVVEDEPEPDPNRIPDAPSSLAPAEVTPGDAPASAAPETAAAASDLTASLSAPDTPDPVAVASQPLEPAPQPEADPVPEETARGTESVLALINPAIPTARPNTAVVEPNVPALETARPVIIAPQPENTAPEPVPDIGIAVPTVEPEPAPAAGAEAPSEVETEIAAANPDATVPTLANAQWIGFTPAVFGQDGGRPGLWIAGPFDRKQRRGWITDTATGSTTRVTFIWREAAPGSQALLSAEAARALGLTPGDVANVAVYLPR